MNVFTYTVDITTPRKLTREEQHNIIMAFDALLESYDMEFEDWKIHTSETTRP